MNIESNCEPVQGLQYIIDSLKCYVLLLSLCPQWWKSLFPNVFMSVKNVICPKLSSQWFLHSDHVLIQASFYCFVGGYDYIAERQWQSTPVLVPGKPHGRRSLEGCSPWGRQELDTTERLPFHFSLSCIGEGNGNPLQCSCLENARDGVAWWPAVYGVTQSQTRLKQLSSSSSSIMGIFFFSGILVNTMMPFSLMYSTENM